ncbi:MAG: TerB family tellurite resistance protein [Labilithrix sp.]|nr:TerB family tellurite resistance protein [Labilithrix sp.]
MDVEERHKVCELIEAVISADGVIAEAEREYLRRIVARFGLPAREARETSGSDFGRTTATLRALTPDVQTRVMALLVDAAVVDGRVDPEERALLLASAASLGIEATALEERIAWRLRAQGGT